MTYPTCHAWSEARVGSDHCPLILDSGEHGAARPKYFYFNDNGYFRRGFSPLFRANGMT